MPGSVDAYIESLPGEQQQLAAAARELILSLVDGVQEKLSFKIPFYHYFGMFCYINAVKDGIDIGFCRGADIAGEFPTLEVKGRAIVATVTIRSKKDVAAKQLREIITTAALWNEEAKRNKIPMVRKRRKN